MRRNEITWVTLFFAIALVVILLILMLPSLARVRSGRRPSCQNNLKEFGLVYKMYSSEAPGEKFPPVQMRHYAAEGGESQFAFIPEITTIYPKFLKDPSWLVCQSDPDPPVLTWSTSLRSQ